MKIFRNTLQVSRPGAMLFLLLLLPCVFAQGPEGFFNRSSYASLSTLFDPRSRTSFSFKSCSSGPILYQEGLAGDYINVTLLSSGTLQFSWRSTGPQHIVTAGSNLNDNRWHDVDIIHSLGSVSLTISKASVLVANNSVRNDLFDLRLESGHPQLIVGRGFTGCLLQGAGVVLSDNSVYSYEVDWDKCPLPVKPGCDGYLADPCFSQPCHEHSRCTAVGGNYQCLCTKRYSGSKCEVDAGPLCQKPEYNQCVNGGTCQEDAVGNSTKCACSPRFTGSACETPVDNPYCDRNPCRNGGTCNINKDRNNYVCTCPLGFAGIDCELNVDECQSSPCHNNGTCTDEINSYSCDCSGTGFRGHNCEENINECDELHPCYTGSRCFDRYGDYMCACPPGFEGKNCDQEVDECASNPCQNKGNCIDNLNGYLCYCVLGFAGINCEENIDDCADVSCAGNSYCEDGIGTFSCVCSPGYAGVVPHCREIDECADAPCLNGGICQDRMNGYNCTCQEGFLGNQCEINIDDCESNPCRNGGVCVDGAGKYICECVIGYSGTNCEVDINDCQPNPCKNKANCTDLVNDFFCECPPGWEGKSCSENVNECLPRPCMHGECVDAFNNFTCVCEPGYMGPLCEININECDSSPCFNSGTCTDLINDYSCNCPEDFMGKNCHELYDACKSQPCQNSGTCQTVVPSHQYHCICSRGFLGNQCETDIDDCEGVVCPAGKVCFDKINSYECRCPDGFTGPDCSKNIDECSSNPCVNGTCIDGIGNFTCSCPTGLTGRLCENDIDECVEHPCRNGLCKNMLGSYLCYCTPGFTGTHCEIEFNECLSAPCQNGANCIDQINNYSCSCLPGFAGRNCEEDINECEHDPCQNSATCIDMINKYECTCVLGFTGKDCEINIDECASQPCLNTGMCVDLINEFSCNCTDTGFTGMYCETNIDDCASNPCQHGAKCEDMIKDYRCNCFKGYNGKNCENDIEECISSPCLNNALCLENSNETLYEMNYLGFFPNFSYEAAAGYRCICASGFTGVDCETNIDDCEFHTCQHGICIDGINDYICACRVGYDGPDCSHEIDECLMLEPCKNNATCTDLVADYRCECMPDYGGKTCQTKLIGCLDVDCENGATCIPLLDDNGHHGYECQCTDGYYGQLCEIATTVSFNVGDSLSVIRYNDLMDEFNLEFKFRTTLPDGILSTGYVPSNMLQYLLYLKNGMVKVDIYNATSRIGELFSKKGQNDATWRSVKLKFYSDEVTLNMTDWVSQKSINFTSLNFTTGFGAANLIPHQQMDDFIGCIQDILINGDVVIPNDNGVLNGAVVGCNRKEQCEGSPCNNGFCKDNWLTYECVCPRPFFGKACQYSYEAATFGYLNQMSRAELVLPEKAATSLHSIMDISCFARTRNETGLLFYLGSSIDKTSNCSLNGMQNTTFLMARMISGKLQVLMKQQNGVITEMLTEERLDNGKNYFIKVTVTTSLLSLKVNDTVQNKTVLTSSVCGEMLYIAGLPVINRQKRQVDMKHFSDEIDILLLEDISFYKGVVQDFRVNDEVVVFYDLNAEGEGFPMVLGKAYLTQVVQRGTVSNDPCNTIMPCHNNAQCMDIWNDYMCICPEDYRGKNCDEKKPCADHSCPSNSECRNLDVGYECVASGAFDGKNSGIQYRVTGIHHNVTNITLSFRSMGNGTILWMEESLTSHFLHIELSTVTSTPTLQIKWDLGPSYENLALHKIVSQKINADGNWNDVQVLFEENMIHLKVLGNAENLSADNYSIGLTELLNNGANVYVGYKPGQPDSQFKGCLNDIRIGGTLLSFFDTTFSPGVVNPFQIVSRTVDIGCTLCWEGDCNHGACINSTESYDCACSEGYEGNHCDTDMCVSQNPCQNQGVCSHLEGLGTLMCSCPQEFIGPTCTDINYCIPMPCSNGGTCEPGYDDFSCSCPSHYEGKTCNESKILDCSKVECIRGSCIHIDVSETIKFKCLCLDGYKGLICNETVDFCENFPCQNGGSCENYEGPDFASYRCKCKHGFQGEHCETDIDECEDDPCVHGVCLNEKGGFRCDCYPGHMGNTCTRKINHCSDTRNVCHNGTCFEAASGGYECTCEEGFLGKHCSIFNECHPSKCNHQGICAPVFNERELVFSHTCSCNDGFSGSDCTKEVARGGGDEQNLIVLILVPVLVLILVCILIGMALFVRTARKKRATRGTYSPSRQEIFGSRVEMNHVMKPPPEERLI